MKVLTFLLVFLYTSEAILATLEIIEKWNNFKNSHRRRFLNPNEETFRRKIFQKKLQKIEEHNTRYRKGLETYQVGVNQFTDYTEEELLPYTHSLQLPLEEATPFVKIAANSSSVVEKALPGCFDWRDKGVVTPVKHQHGCGCCWAFATTGAIESQYKILYGSTVNLSVQQLVDCVPEANGCGGGWMADAYTYIARHGGIHHDKDYPYQAFENLCHVNSNKPKITIKGYAHLVEPNEETLKELLVTKGPISVALDGGGDFSDYSGGVYYNPLCSTNRFTHAAVVVGYGSENGQDYWMVKNSWGVEWGLDGYVKMARNRNNHCGIASKVIYPVF